MNEDSNQPYVLDFDIEDIHLLYRCVCKRIETWEGGNPSEQEHLFYMRDWLYRAVLDYKFKHMDADE